MDNSNLNESGIERRQHKRVATSFSVSVFYLGDFFVAHAVEASEGGLLIVTDHQIQNKSHFEICFSLFGSQFSLIQCESVYSLKRDGQIYIGVRFVSLPETTRQCLEKLAQS